MRHKINTPFSLVLMLWAGMATSCKQQFFVVRHAEKATTVNGEPLPMANNPPLSDAGAARAIALKERLEGEKLDYIYSTNTTRTLQTAAPSAAFFNLTIYNYGKVDKALLKALRKRRSSTLIVGHSNTVDDLVNGLMRKPLLTDLPETTYDKLFILKRKRGRLVFVEDHYGQPSVK